LQYGVCCQFGIEKVSHKVKLLHELRPDLDTITVDFSNAFNSISRHVIANSLIKHFPQLLGYFRSFYLSVPPLLFYSSSNTSEDSSHFIRSFEGVQQGDVLGPLLFSLGTLDIFRSIQEIVSKDSNGEGSTLAYLDDLNVVAPHNACIHVLQFLNNLDASIGLKLNPSKSVAFPCKASYDDNTASYRALFNEMIIPHKDEGFDLLGVPCGSDNYIINYLQDYLQKKFLPVVEKVRNFPDMQVQFQYLHYIILNKTNHFYRTLSPHLLSQQFIPSIEDSIKKLFCQIFEIQKLLPIQWSQACLPINKGGFGMGFIKDIAFSAYPASFMTASPQMLQSFSKDEILNSSLGKSFIDSINRINECIPNGSKKLNPTSLSYASSKHLQKYYHQFYTDHAHANFIIETKRNAANYHKVRSLSIQGEAGGLFLIAGPKKDSKFTKQEFLTAAWLRLGIALKGFNPHFICKCVDNYKSKSEVGIHAQHCFVCKHGNIKICVIML